MYGEAYENINKGNLAKAKLLLEKVLLDVEKLFGPNHRLMFSALSDLASIQTDLNNQNKARVIYQQALDGFSKLGDDDLFVVNTMHACACLLTKPEDALKAKILYEQVLSEYEYLIGPDKESTLNAAHNLAMQHIKLGNLSKARILLERVVLGFKKRFGSDHVKTKNELI